MSARAVRWLLLAAGVFSVALQAQTPGQFRIVDFSARASLSAAAVTNGTEIRTATPHGLKTGAAVYIYPPLTVAQDANVPGFRNAGNRGRGYFIIEVTDETHFSLTSEMYTGAPVDRSKYSVSAGDAIVPLTTYQVRQGPRVWLDGPINKGVWSASASYRTHDLVTNGGKSYVAFADHTNHEPPDTNYWVEVDPARIGAGTFSASLRDPGGKASDGNLAFSQLKAMQAKYWPQPARTYDYGFQAFPNGFGGTLAAERWFADGDKPSYTAALRLATQAEDLADGTVACDPVTDYCGRNRGNIDFSRLDAWKFIPAMAMIYDTLSADQKKGLMDRLFNDNDVAHNGIETRAGTNCDVAAYNPGPGTLSVSNYVVKGSGFNSLDGLVPGAVLVYVNIGLKTALGRIKSVDSDTQITLEQAAYAAASGTVASIANWWYVKPFGYAGAHTCGVLWILKHHPSSPRMIPGQEGTYGLQDYTTITTPDDSPRQNKSISALVPFIAAALLGAHDDVRAVRLGEQAINYYMTQTMAQEQKSRGTGLDGHGTQYGTGRTASGEMAIAWMLKNSLTVTPPGILSGIYLTSIMQAYQYVFWLGNPLVVQPWATGYGININANGSLYLSYIGVPMMIAANLYPDDPFASHTWDYLRNRRGDYGNLSEPAGWGSIAFITWAFPFYDPQAKMASITSAPLQRALWHTDEQECIDAGLYCRPDTGEYLTMSQTGWGNTDTQVMIQAQAALPTQDDDNYGTAGTVTILQNNGTNSTYLLSGNGLGISGYGSGQSPASGMEHGNTISIFNPAAADMWAKAIAARLYARLGRWAGDPVTGVGDNSYTYTMVDLTPTVRDSAHRYDPANAARMCFYLAAACTGPGGAAARVHRHVIHFKNPADPNYVVIYDDIQAGPENLQPRAYFHYQASSLQASDKTRHPEWITTFDPRGKRVVLTIPGSARLSSLFLAVPESAPASVLGRAIRSTRRIALVTDEPGGTYKNITGLPAASPPGTYRVTVCASHDGEHCITAKSAEWIAIHKPSIDLNDSMPPADQPACAGIGGDCAAVQIRDDHSSKVAVFARQGVLLRGAGFTTFHGGEAQYVIAGLTPGTYTVTVGTTVVLNGAVVAPNDTTLSFSSAAGNVRIELTGLGVSSITIAPSTTIQTGAQQQLSATCTFPDSTTRDCTALLTWASSVPDVATVSGSGLVTGAAAGTTTISGSYLGAIGSAVITVNPGVN